MLGHLAALGGDTAGEAALLDFFLFSFFHFTLAFSRQRSGGSRVSRGRSGGLGLRRGLDRVVLGDLDYSSWWFLRRNH